MRFERIYLVAMTYLVAILITAFALSGCKALGSLTAPDGLTGKDAFSLTTNLSNAAGEATILDAQIIVDRVVVADSCPEEDQFPNFDADGNQAGTSCVAPATATATLSTAGHIGPGTHTMHFFMSSQTSTRSTYTVLPFTVRVFDQNGAHLNEIDLPGQTASLKSGESISYTFTI